MDEEQTDMLDAELLDRSQLINNLVTEAGEPSWTIRKCVTSVFLTCFAY